MSARAPSRLVAVLAILVVRLGAAQTIPKHTVTISLGLTPAGPLWTLGGTYLNAPQGAVDTLALGRAHRPAFALGVEVARIRGSWLALTGSLAYLGLPTVQSCRVVGAYKPDPTQFNEAVCTASDQRRRSASLVVLEAGVMSGPLRAGLGPFVQVKGGVALLSGETIATRAFVTTSRCGQCQFLIIDRRPGSFLTWTGRVAIGIRSAPIQGTGIRLEVHDLMAAVPAPKGPPSVNDPYLRVALRRSVRHLVGGSLGAEVALARSHRRRY